MARDDPPRRRTTPEAKAQNLLRRFPIVDLAHAVSLTSARRRSFLNTFVKTFTTMSYVPTREVVPMIYGVQKPLFETPLEPWSRVQRHLEANTRSEILDMNLEASKHLFDLVRSYNYVATDCEVQVLRVRLKQIVNIGLSFYVTDGDRLIFQFPLVRRECLTDEAVRVLGSIIHHSYVQGDFATAEIEVADVSCPQGSKNRDVRIRPVSSNEILGRSELTSQIIDVYALLAEISDNAKPQSEDPND